MGPVTEPSRQPRPLSAAPVVRPLWTLAGPGLSAVLVVCQFAVLLGPLHRAVQRDLGFTVTVLVIVVVSYLVSAAVGFSLGFVLGRRAPTSVVVSALLLVLVGAVVMALSNTSIMLLAAGLVAGLGGGAILGTAVGLTGQVGVQRLGQVRLALGLAVFGGVGGRPGAGLVRLGRAGLEVGVSACGADDSGRSGRDDCGRRGRAGARFSVARCRHRVPWRRLLTYLDTRCRCR